MIRRTLTIGGVLALVAATVSVALADFNDLPKETVNQYAGPLAEAANGQFGKAPLAPELEVEAAKGLASDAGGGMIFIPQKGLSAEGLAKAGQKPVSLGVLFSLQVSLVGKTGPLTNEQLTTVEVNGSVIQAALLLVRAGKGDARILDVYGKGKKPIISVPLTAIKAGGSGITLQVENFDGNTGTGDLQVTIAGKYQATLPVAVTS